ncbi:hypothetical protein HPB47_002751 [Ixodes persulcatus]|uniref:Uncharacterized protein n=1 Tax=Ixodes persulcatus TaxID=34615 RepID=A0AC60PKD7_IXOPE|nr:hypothetical protein HPB47_002751 [Ixodes persulcatus]
MDCPSAQLEPLYDSSQLRVKATERTTLQVDTVHWITVAAECDITGPVLWNSCGREILVGMKKGEVIVPVCPSNSEAMVSWKGPQLGHATQVEIVDNPQAGGDIKGDRAKGRVGPALRVEGRVVGETRGVHGDVDSPGRGVHVQEPTRKPEKMLVSLFPLPSPSTCDGGRHPERLDGTCRMCVIADAAESLRTRLRLGATNGEADFRPRQDGRCRPSVIGPHRGAQLIQAS